MNSAPADKDSHDFLRNQIILKIVVTEYGFRASITAKGVFWAT